VQPVGIPDDGEFAATAADTAAHAQAHYVSRTLAGRDQRRQIQKDVPTARPAENIQLVPVFVKHAEGVEDDDHARR
jgi:hypothetical protein